MNKPLLLLLLIGLLPGLAFAEAEPTLENAHANIEDTASVQRGAKYFVNYCMGCHELKYVRFQRVAADLHIPKTAAMQYLVFGQGVDITDMMTNAMPESRAADWFGKTPPDLSVAARQRGADWIYTYLKQFYLDPERPTGVNNMVLKNPAMPDVLWQLQGLQRVKFKTVKEAGGATHEEFAGFEHVTKGTLTPEQYDRVVRDITNFLVYVGEPARLAREDIGWAAIIFILVLIGLTYALKRDTWRDLHSDRSPSEDLTDV